MPDTTAHNVLWRLEDLYAGPEDPALDADFLAEAAARQLSGLKGHKSVGGMRASLYNAMTIAGVEALVDLMQDFAARKA